ncbi:uncharacterized protein LOC135391892 isoform X2 [Ornithodoros turicata]
MLPPGHRANEGPGGFHDPVEPKNAWELRFAYKTNPRPPYLTATDYVFYLKRQSRKGRGERTSPVSHEDAMVELTNFTELMRRLKEDLRSSYSSFVEEFVSEPNDGVTLLLDLLKSYRKSSQDGCATLRPSHQQQLKKKIAEEQDCLQCLLYSLRCQKSLPKIINHSTGLCTIASSIMSSCTKSRKLALELLAKTCDEHPAGHSKVIEAMSSVRLIYGEPVRFKFLVSMLQSGGKMIPGFEWAAMYFFNVLLSNSKGPSERIRLQSELEEAGFDISILEKNLREKSVPSTDSVWDEITRWKRTYLDVGTAINEQKRVGNENGKLKTEVELLRRALKKMEEDKINLMQIERDLKEKCEDLQQEVLSLKKVIEEPKSSSKTSDAEDSDQSDAQATDSGRSSFLEYSTEIEQPTSDEVIIDIPTIRPPAGFQSDFDEMLVDEPRGPLQISPAVAPQACHLTSTPTVPYTGFSPRTDDIEWNYPALPEMKVIRKSSRADEKPRVIGVHRFDSAARRRSKSEDRRRLNNSSTYLNNSPINLNGSTLNLNSSSLLNNTSMHVTSQQESTHEIISNGILQDRNGSSTECSPPLKFEDTSGFILRKPCASINNNNNTAKKTVTSTMPRNVHRVSNSIDNDDSDDWEVPEDHQQRSLNSSFPMAFSYKTNFILKGHGNCGMYSNKKKAERSAESPPADSVSAEVHREITDAVRQISGWL